MNNNQVLTISVASLSFQQQWPKDHNFSKPSPNAQHMRKRAKKKMRKIQQLTKIDLMAGTAFLIQTSNNIKTSHS
jgi:hypothetical protein